ncbi:hypothetical protein EON64_19735, partial [archaeon]
MDFLIKNGAERFIENCRDKLYKIRSLQDYNFYEANVDKGQGIREKAKQLVELLNSNEMIRTEREKARALRNKFVGIDSRNATGGYAGGGSLGSSYGKDSYSSGGGGGRYGNDFVSSDSYSSGGNRRASDSNMGRYGGGAYDSDKPNRYSDDVPEERSDFRANSDRRSQSKYADEPASQEVDDWGENTTKSGGTRRNTVATPPSSVSTGGKLKVAIKKTATAPVVAPRETEIDLIGEPISSGGGDFDPFSAPPAAPAASHAPSNFDPFGGGGSNNFDPFSAPAAAP